MKLPQRSAHTVEAKIEVFRTNYVNFKAADAMAPCVTIISNHGISLVVQG